MKRFIHFAFLVAVASTLVVTTNCGSSGSPATSFSTTTANSALINGVGSLPGGGAMINFTGVNVFNDGVAIFAGGSILNGSSSGTTFCGNFYLGSNCWTFSNPRDPNGTGQIIIGGTGAGLNSAYTGSYGYTGYGYPAVSANAFRSTSKYDPASSIVIIPTSIGTDVFHENVSGTLILSSSFIQAHFGGIMPSILGMAFDFGLVSSGGVVLYTSQDPSGTKGFLAF